MPKLRNKFFSFYRHSLLLSLFYALFSVTGLPIKLHAEGSPPILGDRLILSINNVPYSQLQIEGLMNIKETLRSDPSLSQVVSSANWNIALAGFIIDMTIYQEASKTSGYRPRSDAIEKATEKVKENLDKTPKFKNRLLELGLDNSTIRDHITRLMTIENLRQSRQGATQPDKAKVTTDNWEQELTKAAIVRWFDQGKTYLPITPPKKS